MVVAGQGRTIHGLKLEVNHRLERETLGLAVVQRFVTFLSLTSPSFRASKSYSVAARA